MYTGVTSMVCEFAVHEHGLGLDAHDVVGALVADEFVGRYVRISPSIFKDKYYFGSIEIFIVFCYAFWKE